MGPRRPQPQRRCRTRGVLGANAVPRATSLAQRLGRSGLQPSPPGPSALCAWWAGPSSLFRQLQGGQCPSGQEEGPLRAGGQGAHPTAPSRSPTATQGHTSRAQTLRPRVPACGRVGTDGPSPWGRFDQAQCVQWLCLLTLSVACYVLVTQPLMVSSPRVGVSPVGGAWERVAALLGACNHFHSLRAAGTGAAPGCSRARHRSPPSLWTPVFVWGHRALESRGLGAGPHPGSGQRAPWT